MDGKFYRSAWSAFGQMASNFVWLVKLIQWSKTITNVKELPNLKDIHGRGSVTQIPLLCTQNVDTFLEVICLQPDVVILVNATWLRTLIAL